MNVSDSGEYFCLYSISDWNWLFKKHGIHQEKADKYLYGKSKAKAEIKEIPYDIIEKHLLKINNDDIDDVFDFVSEDYKSISEYSANFINSFLNSHDKRIVMLEDGSDQYNFAIVDINCDDYQDIFGSILSEVVETKEDVLLLDQLIDIAKVDVKKTFRYEQIKELIGFLNTVNNEKHYYLNSEERIICVSEIKKEE